MTCHECAHCYRPVAFKTPEGLPVCGLRYRVNGASSPKNLVRENDPACDRFEEKDKRPQMELFRK